MFKANAESNSAAGTRVASKSASVAFGALEVVWGVPFIGSGVGSADLSAGVAFAALEVVWGVLVYR